MKPTTTTTTTEQRHTPGPWHISKAATDRAIYGKMGEHIATLPDMLQGDEVLANAKLIASAPELLEALDKAAQQAQIIVDNHESLKRKGNELQLLAISVREICDAAIARATGGQQ